MKDITTRAELDQLLKDKQRVLVDFWASWCGPCKIMIPRLEKIETQYPDVVFVKFSAEEPEGLSTLKEVYRGSSLPTLILIKDGNEAGRLTGLQSVEALEELLSV